MGYPGSKQLNGPNRALKADGDVRAGRSPISALVNGAAENGAQQRDAEACQQELARLSWPRVAWRVDWVGLNRFEGLRVGSSQGVKVECSRSFS